MNPILQALGVLDPAGRPTARLDVVKAARVAKLNQDDWQKEREAMAAICNQCHSGNFAKEQLAQGDNVIREADRLMAEAIRVVAGLYQDGSLQKPANYASPFRLNCSNASSPSSNTRLASPRNPEKRTNWFGWYTASHAPEVWLAFSPQPSSSSESRTKLVRFWPCRADGGKSEEALIGDAD